MSTPGLPSSELVMYAARLVRVIRRISADDSASTLRLLSQLDELGATTVTVLAKADRTAQPTMSAALRSLEEDGLVSRVTNPADARSTLITLTPEGRTALRSARQQHAEILADLVAVHGVSQDDLERAVHVLRTLTAPIDPTTPES